MGSYLLCNDDFNRSDSTIMTGQQNTFGSYSGSQIKSNQFKSNAGSMAMIYNNHYMPSPNQQTELTLGDYTTTCVGILMLRVIPDELKYYSAFINTTLISISYTQPGSSMNLGMISTSIGSGDVVKFEIVDRTLKIYKNGVLLQNNVHTGPITGRVGCGIYSSDGFGGVNSWSCGVIHFNQMPSRFRRLELS